MRAPFELAQMVVPGMRERGAGWILNITSRAGIHPQGPPFMELYKRGFTVYGMVKAALDRFTTGLAAEVYDDGIAVNSLAPWDNVAHAGCRCPRPRRRGSPTEDISWMAEAALALCSCDPARAHRSRRLQPAAAGRAAAPPARAVISHRVGRVRA